MEQWSEKVGEKRGTEPKLVTVRCYSSKTQHLQSSLCLALYRSSSSTRRGLGKRICWGGIPSAHHAYRGRGVIFFAFYSAASSDVQNVNLTFVVVCRAVLS